MLIILTTIELTSRRFDLLHRRKMTMKKKRQEEEQKMLMSGKLVELEKRRQEEEKKLYLSGELVEYKFREIIEDLKNSKPEKYDDTYFFDYESWSIYVDNPDASLNDAIWGKKGKNEKTREKNKSAKRKFKMELLDIFKRRWLFFPILK